MHTQIRPYFFTAVFVVSLILAMLILAPFLKPLALAAVFAVVLQGFYKRVLKLFRGWASTSALLTVFLSALLFLIPVYFVGTLVANEASSVYVSLESSGGGRTFVTQLIERANDSYGNTIPGLKSFSMNAPATIDTYTKEVLQWVAMNAGGIFSKFSQFLLSLFIFFIALYYLLRDGAHMRKLLIELSPLADRDDTKILDQLERAISSVIKGNLALAFIQGVLTTIGFMLFGVPNGVLWGALAALSALVPGIGTGLVFIPAIAFLFFTGATVPAIGLLIWGALGVGLIDNFLGPRLVGRGMDLHPLFVLLSIFGGLAYFGPVGVFLGPLSVSFLLALLSIYSDLSRRV
jgi:predicted PurR-regulated permease PerM